MTHADRARIKRQMSIGEYPGENDLDRNEFRVTTYVHVNGVKHEVGMIGRLYCITLASGWKAYSETLDGVRECAEAMSVATP